MLGAFLEHTKCIPSCAESLTFSNLSGEAGFFRLDGIRLYGRTLGGERARRYTEDVKAVDSLVTCTKDATVLPFSPTEVIDNLRLEKYADVVDDQNANLTRKESVLWQAYYAARPFFPVAVRRVFQRIALRDWAQIPFPAWPLDTSVDDFVNWLWMLVLQTTGQAEIPFIWYWPKGFQSCAMMTHDVETAAGQDFIPTILELESEQGIKSAFEFVPEVRYKISERVFEAIRGAGSEICVHGLNHDGKLFSSEGEFRKRAKAINQYAKEWGARGFRSPVMYRNLNWYDAFTFSYDMSVPNVAHLDPQRGGCCTIFPYFVGDIVELPLTTTQDYSLYNILCTNPLEMWEKQANGVSRRHGLASFIVHPDYIIERKRQDDYRNLLRMLRRCAEKDKMWLALPGEIDMWWRARHEMTLTRENGTWSVSGKESHRAAVAFARLERDHVVFRVAS